MFRSLATATLLAAGIAAPASATIFTTAFIDTGANVATVTKSAINLGVTVSTRAFFLTPSALTNLSNTTTTGAGLLTRSAAGLGIAGGGVSATQMDTNNAGTALAPRREAFLLTGTKAFRLNGLTLTNVDADDTLKIYGIKLDGSFVDLGFGSGTNAGLSAAAVTAGTIRGGAGGTLTGLVNTAANSGTSAFGFANATRYTRYLVTSRVGGDVTYLGSGGQGFALKGMAATVPEPQTWALMIIGFGLVGVTARRRNKAVAA
jgi:hypothetical protein